MEIAEGMRRVTPRDIEIGRCKGIVKLLVTFIKTCLERVAQVNR